LKAVIGALRTAAKFAIVGAMLLGCNVAWGAIGSCPTASGTSIDSVDGGTSNNLSDGCGQVDKSFSNFNVATTACAGTCVGGAEAPATDNTYFWTSGTAPTGNTFSQPVDTFFAPSTGTPDWINFDGEVMFTTTYTVIANSGGTYNGGSSTYPSPSVGLYWAIPEIGVTASGDAGSGTITVAETFCLGASTTSGCAPAGEGTIIAGFSGSGLTFSCTFDGSSCSASNGGSFDTSTGLLTFDAAEGANTEIAISDAVTIAGGGGAAELDQFENDFYEDAVSPEPSSFLLVGSTLAGIGLLGWRKRRAC
jgi:hypothetical protein